MKKIKPYLDLIRFYNQTGTILLFIPCLLGLAYSSHTTGSISMRSLVLFYLCSFIARSCGCILNDVADAKIDAQLPTTNKRVLAQGVLNKRRAILFFASLTLCGLPLLAFYSRHIFIPLIVIGVLTIVYPYLKRFFCIPQLLLGVVYASGILMAVINEVNAPFWQLDERVYQIYCALILWVIFYDTIYAKRDLRYDIPLKINSSAILFTTRYKLIMPFITLIFILFFIFALKVHSFYILGAFMCIVIALFYTNYNFPASRQASEINNILIIILGISNLILLYNGNFIQSIFCMCNLAMQGICIFTRPALGFKMNTLCAIPMVFAV